MRYLLFLPVSLLTQALASPLTKRIPENFAFAAFGDSFSAGIGAGNFFTGSPDDRDNICARMTESYPAQLVNIFLRGKVSHFDFFSCSGDILDDIDGQVAKLVGNHVDVASLSISGNDFNFGNVVVSACHP
jgi:lysophospholipase L1-like esterase